LALTRRNPTLGSGSRLNPGPTLRGPREWVGLRKKCSTQPNDHTILAILIKLYNCIVLKIFLLNNLNKQFIFKKIKIKVNFELYNNLIYYIKDNKRYARLYILSIVYNKRYYIDVNCCYNYIVAILYILQLSKKIYNYIKYYLFY